MKLTGRMVEGERVYDNPAARAIANRTVKEGARFQEEFGPEKKQRTVKANRRHFVLIALLRHYVNSQRPNELPLSKEQIHYRAVMSFGGCEETPLGPVPKKSSLMDTHEFFLMDEALEVWLAEKNYRLRDYIHATDRQLEEAGLL